MVDSYMPLICEEIRNAAEPKENAWLFHDTNMDNALALPKYGAAIILSTTQADALIAGRADSVLLRKLSAYGFFGTICRNEIKDRQPKPTFLMIDVTTRCNLNCAYCLRHFPDEGENISQSSLDSILSYIIQYCKDQQINRLKIQPWGGEPLLAVDAIFSIQDTLEANGIHVDISVQTNGLLLSKEMVARLHQRRIQIGVSIDGCQEIQDLQRKGWGKTNSYQRVKEGIDNLRSVYGTNFGIISVITHQSIPYIEKSLDFFCKTIGLRSAKLNPVHPNGGEYDSEFMLTNEDIRMFVSTLLTKLVELNESNYPFFESNVRDKIINLLIGKGHEICHSEGCTGGYAFLTFSRDGEIYPCELVGQQDVRIGSIQDGKPLMELLEGSIENNPYFLPKESEECSSCPWFAYCRGGCTASCIANGWGWGSVDKTECAINRELYPRLIRLILEKPELVYELTNHELRITE